MAPSPRRSTRLTSKTASDSPADAQELERRIGQTPFKGGRLPKPSKALNDAPASVDEVDRIAQCPRRSERIKNQSTKARYHSRAEALPAPQKQDQKAVKQAITQTRRRKRASKDPPSAQKRLKDARPESFNASRLTQWLEQSDFSQAVDMAPSIRPSTLPSFPTEPVTDSIPEESGENTNKSGKTGASRSKPRIDKATYEMYLASRGAAQVEGNERDEHGFVSELRNRTGAPQARVLQPRQINALIEETDKFLTQCKRAKEDDAGSIREEFEKFRQSINDILPWLGMFTTTNDDFAWDKNLVKISNEYVLQSTILMTAVDRVRLDDKIRFDREGRWDNVTEEIQPPRYFAQLRHGPAGGEDALRGAPLAQDIRPSCNQPDLTLAFDREKLEGDVHVWDFYKTPSGCIQPQKNSQLCFPFLFFEAKRDTTGLGEARLRNLHHAMQALWGMYLCMKDIAQLEAFFKHVRVFSIVITPDCFEARAHRAVQEKESGRMLFKFEIIRKAGDYGRDELCQLVREISAKYASGVLWDIARASLRLLSQTTKAEPIFEQLAACPPQYFQDKESCDADDSKRF